MQPSHLLVAIVGFALVCGLFHPWLGLAVVFVSVLEGPLFFGFTPLVLLFSSLSFATACLILTGIPAALFERFTGRQESDLASLWIWLVAMALVALPAFGNFFRFGF